MLSLQALHDGKNHTFSNVSNSDERNFSKELSILSAMGTGIAYSMALVCIMNSFRHKPCQGIGQGDPEKCKSLCIHCSNVPFTEKLNELQTKKGNYICKTKKKLI